MKKEIEAEVGALDKEFDGATCTYYWRATLFFNEIPDLKLGKCKVIQDSELHKDTKRV